MTDATATPITTVITADPLLIWTAIAEHARQEHGARWASDAEAVTAIVGAFDAILPTACGYDLSSGTVAATGSPQAARMPGWADTQILACTVAALATAPRTCDLQALYLTENLVA
jgi:hypothetical protein